MWRTLFCKDIFYTSKPNVGINGEMLQNQKWRPLQLLYMTGHPSTDHSLGNMLHEAQLEPSGTQQSG